MLFIRSKKNMCCKIYNDENLVIIATLLSQKRKKRGEALCITIYNFIRIQSMRCKSM